MSIAAFTLVTNWPSSRLAEDQRVHVLGLPALDEAVELTLRDLGVESADRKHRFEACCTPIASCVGVTTDFTRLVDEESVSTPTFLPSRM